MTEERDEKAGDCFSDDRKRCAWITPKSDKSCIAFHNEEWGVPVHGDNLPSVLLELSWKSFRFKRQSFRKFFKEFDSIPTSELTNKKREHPLRHCYYPHYYP
ncbi:hypothetical protein DY000_02017394 [Brassica cretica]|uniref:Uncharacterized protein n=1 Tax=Brassica cretica TaxID=69181 RepID=A0ABQ7DBG8_BRACR|nr:hypothetical protein DY000_02017394 [Brassica cretica]